MVRKVFLLKLMFLTFLLLLSCRVPSDDGASKRPLTPKEEAAAGRLIHLGNKSFEEARYNDALDYYTGAITLFHGRDNSNLTSALYNRGLAYLKKGSYERAIIDFSSVLEINPTDGRAYYNRGNAFALANSHERAIDDYSRAIALNPGKAYLYYSRGLAYQEVQQYYERAIEDFKQAVVLNPEDKKSYCFLGITYYKMKNYREAQKYFGKALSIDPGYAEAITGRGQAYLRQGKMEKALSDYRKACDMGDDTGCIMLELLARKKPEP